jgi:ferredoxin-NADP reductase
MAIPKEARVTGVTDLTPSTRLLELEPAAPLDFVGGQYVIVNSGLTLPDGKLAKRAYSFISADERQDRVVMAVRKHGDGAASNWMHTRQIGDVVPFSGPWGKWLADDATPRRTFILATDTGITASLGLVRGRAFAPQRSRATIVWLAESASYFLPDDFVRATLPDGVTFTRLALPPVGHPERIAHAEQVAAAHSGFDSVFLVGDGAVVCALRDRVFPQARVETFFNHPAKKSA